MSPIVFHIENMNRVLTVAWKLISNEACRVWIFPWDLQPDVHIFDTENNTGDMHFFLNRYNKKKFKKNKNKRNLTLLKYCDVINVSNECTRMYRNFKIIFMAPSETTDN